MAVITPQLALVLEPALFVPQPNAAAPVTNPDLAQGGPAPEEDTVALINRAGEDQGAQESTNLGQQQLAAFALAGQTQVGLQTNAAQNQRAVGPILPSQAPVNPNDLNQLQDATSVGSGALNQNLDTATGNAANPSGPQTPEQELAQLDQTLQEIGINPQGISLFSRMAMLLYANDPAALRVLVQNQQQSFQQTQPQTGNVASTAPQTNSVDASTVAQNGTAPAPSLPAQFQASATGTGPPPPTAGARGTAQGASTPQFAQFQQTFTAIDQEFVGSDNSAVREETPAATVDISV